MKKILQKPISKILVAGVLFYVFYMVNKNKGLLSIPINEEDMKNAITLEEKRYDGNSLIEDTYENSELVNTIKTGEGMEI